MHDNRHKDELTILITKTKHKNEAKVNVYECMCVHYYQKNTLKEA